MDLGSRKLWQPGIRTSEGPDRNVDAGMACRDLRNTGADRVKGRPRSICCECKGALGESLAVCPRHCGHADSQCKTATAIELCLQHPVPSSIACVDQLP